MNGPRRSPRAHLLFACLALGACASPASQPPVVAAHPLAPPPGAGAPADLATLTEGQVVEGFVTRALYVDDDGRVRGGRFVHGKTGFVLDYVAMETAPQVMFHVDTYPTGDGGEPHTQEHLLLGKGNKGRWLGNVQNASFAETSAFTAPHETSYGLTTSAGPETFFRLLRTTFDALLHPDYDDEEIRREVRNFGVTKHPDGTLALDEKGTVYNEMVTTFDAAGEQEWTESLRLVYGRGHPLANVSGGTPEGIRALTPAAIRAFHAAHYQLGNMGFVGAFPSSLPLSTVLSRTGEILSSFAPATGAPPLPAVSEATLPSPHGAPAGTIRIAEYPLATTDHPSPAMLVWPATRALSVDERTELEIFLRAFAGGEGSSIYKALVDRTSRVLDVGATNVWAGVGNDRGQVIRLGIEDIASVHADEAGMIALRDLVRAQLQAIATLPDGSKELVAFDERVKARVIETRRYVDKWLDTPPEFAARSTGPTWIESLDDMAHTPGFKKRLTYSGGIDGAMALASTPKNPWRDRINAWGLLDVPYVVATRPSPSLRARLDHERDLRVATELARLEAEYGTHDPQEALRKREGEITQATEAIAKQEASVPPAPLASDPPMTNDDSLQWTTETRDGVPRVVATFPGMKSATVGLQLGLDAIPDELLPWLGVLPLLMSEVGVVRDGLPVPYDEVSDRLRREILGVNVHYTGDFNTGRAQIALEASGNGVDETKRALGWVRDFLATPDWRPENLPRLRDVLAKKLTTLHGTMSDREERWVEGVETAVRRQDRTVLLHAYSDLTRVHDAFLTSWMLEGGVDARPVVPFLRSLAAAGKTLDRKGLAALAETLASTDPKHAVDPKGAAWVKAGRALPKGAQSRVQKAGHDLGQLLVDLPDTSLAGDWKDLCGEMADGIALGPDAALDALKRTRDAVRHARNASLWIVASAESQRAIADDVERTLASLDPAPAPALVRPKRAPIFDRARARGAGDESAYVALVNPSTGSSSIVFDAPGLDYDEARPEALTDLLALNVFGGEGTQSFYKRIWGAALAYSGYVYESARSGRKVIYSDRCADVPQLLHFVEGEVRKAPNDPRLVDQAVAPVFGSRVADEFETRGRAMAEDLGEGWTPERTRAFRQRILDLRAQPGLADRMYARFIPAMSGVIPSLAPSTPPPAGALYFTVAPEPRVADFEKEIQHTQGDKIRVLRLWARDFWEVKGR